MLIHTKGSRLKTLSLAFIAIGVMVRFVQPAPVTRSPKVRQDGSYCLDNDAPLPDGSGTGPFCWCPRVSTCIGSGCRAGYLTEDHPQAFPPPGRGSQTHTTAATHADGFDHAQDEAAHFMSRHESTAKHRLVLASGYPPECSVCRCVSMQPYRDVVRLHGWHPTQWYYHLHVSKTAGTTFRKFLEDFSDKYPSVRSCDQYARKGPDWVFVNPSLLAGGTCHVLSAEGLYSKIDAQFSHPPHLLLLFRHPVLRTLSQFNHDKRRHPEFTLGATSLAELYDRTAETPVRFGNWYVRRLLDAEGVFHFDTVKRAAFFGITEFYQTSMCLFYFTFQLQREFSTCQNDTPTAHNVACSGYFVGRQQRDGEKVKEICGGSDQSGGHHPEFVSVESEKEAVTDPHSAMWEALARIPDLERSAIEAHVQEDLQVYEKALHLFWVRVAAMQAASGKLFPELPEAYQKLF